MNNKDYLKWAITKDRTTQQYFDLHARIKDQNLLRLLHSVMGLSGEMGEFTDSVKKSIMYGKELDVKNLKEEIGDLLWYMSIALDSLGSSFEEVMKLNHDKLEARYPGGFTEKLAVERRDKK